MKRTLNKWSFIDTKQREEQTYKNGRSAFTDHEFHESLTDDMK